MSAPVGSVAALSHWDPTALAAAGARLGREGEELRRFEAEAARSMAGLTGLRWTGAAATATAEAGRAVTDAFTRSADAADLTARAVQSAGEVLVLARALLDRATDLAAAHGLVLQDDGSVRPPPPELSMPMTPAQDLLRSSRQEAAVVAAQSAQAMATEALASAAEADRDAARALAAADHLHDGLVTRLAPDLFAAAAARGLLDRVALRPPPPPGTAPAVVAAWWDGLPATARDRELARDPRAVGAADGLPAVVRDRANRVELDRLLAGLEELEADLPGGGPMADAARDGVRAKRRQLTTVREQLERPGALLLGVDTTGPGRAVIALGDVDAADHVAVLVPGLGSHVTNYLPRLVSSARAVQDRAEAVGNGSVVGVAWIGYDAPGVATTLRSGRAKDGAVPLAATLRGFDARAVAARRDLHLTVAGHSYGSLVAGYALRERTGADDLIAIGAPGLGIDSLDELHLPAGGVHVGEADRDPVADVGLIDWFGGDPSGAQLGARRFQTDGSVGHSGYYEPGSESLDNIGLIVAGRADRASYE